MYLENIPIQWEKGTFGLGKPKMALTRKRKSLCCDVGRIFSFKCCSKILWAGIVLTTVILPWVVLINYTTRINPYLPSDTSDKKNEHILGVRIPTVTSPQTLSPNPNAKYSVCVLFYDGLGNQMFHFASAFGIAASKNMSLIISDSGSLSDIFEIDAINKSEDFIKKNCTKRNQASPHKYDKKMLSFKPDRNYVFHKYLQSWKYFYNSSTALREQFQFKLPIIKERDSIIQSILEKNNLRTRSDANLIGVHIRRGNFLRLNRDGKSPASIGYLKLAVDYFLLKGLPNTIFVVCSDDLQWSVENFPSYVASEFIFTASPAVDMAVLGACDNMISTTGMFSWWAGWLTEGEVTYYQWPQIHGAPKTRSFDKDYDDLFYPGWIGLY